MKNKKQFVVSLMLALAFATSACSSATLATQTAPAATDGQAASTPAAKTSASPSQSSSEWTIQITGGGKTKFTNKDFAALKNVKITATLNHMGASSTDEYTGVLLTDVLKFAGVTTFKSIQILASDNYSKDYKAADISNDTTILATTKNGAVLSTDEGPVFLIVGPMTGNFWVKHVAKIVVTK